VAAAAAAGATSLATDPISLSGAAEPAASASSRAYDANRLASGGGPGSRGSPDGPQASLPADSITGDDGGESGDSVDGAPTPGDTPGGDFDAGEGTGEGAGGGGGNPPGPRDRQVARQAYQAESRDPQAVSQAPRAARLGTGGATDKGTGRATATVRAIMATARSAHRYRFHRQDDRLFSQ
jgi:hypothetical protein